MINSFSKQTAISCGYSDSDSDSHYDYCVRAKREPSFLLEHTFFHFIFSKSFYLKGLNREQQQVRLNGIDSRISVEQLEGRFDESLKRASQRTVRSEEN